MSIFIVAPANHVTGGPELCHQLADMLNRDSKRARIVYYPFNRQHETPDPYRRYNVYPASVDDIEPGSTVVLPEVYGDLVTQFPGSQVYFWWLSVDNFFCRAGTSDDAYRQLAAMRPHIARHLYQSDYARAFLESLSLMPSRRLSDCLSNEYISAIADHPPDGPREDILVYNPVKACSRTGRILGTLNKRLAPPQVVPVKGMTRDEVRELLGRARVYIDFGGHPGKDRLPREAAAMGACVLTNRRGSAANSVDMPIPAEYKINDRKPGWERRAANKIHLLMSDFERQAPRFDTYRRMIAREPVDFRNDVDAVFTDSDHA